MRRRSCTKLTAEDVVGIASACAQLRFLNLDGCLVPGSCVVRVLAARQGIRFCHQLASLADEAEESPMWRDQQARGSGCWRLQPGPSLLRFLLPAGMLANDTK